MYANIQPNVHLYMKIFKYTYLLLYAVIFIDLTPLNAAMTVK